MGKAYDEIMETIKVTPEMRRRILDRVAQEDVTAANVVRIPAWKKYLAVAACFVLLLAGAALPYLLNRAGPEPPLLTVPDIVEVGSLQELAEMTGFTITERFHLPFVPVETTYTSYWSELAQIEYSGEGQSAVFRKSVGTEDNSGDFSVYRDSAELTIGGDTVLLKGNDENYALAVWTDGEYAYSLGLSEAVTVEAWGDILRP